MNLYSCLGLPTAIANQQLFFMHVMDANKNSFHEALLSAMIFPFSVDKSLRRKQNVSGTKFEII